MSISEKLIEMVRNYDVLYNTNNPDYMKIKLKDEIWVNIARELKLNNGKYENSLFKVTLYVLFVNVFNIFLVICYLFATVQHL